MAQSTRNILKPLSTSIEFYVFLFVLAALYSLSKSNFLIFHSFIEGLPVIISISAFVLVWNLRKLYVAPLLTFIGIGLLFVGILDAFHLLSYAGMGVFSFADPKNPPTQFWIAARYLQALTFLAAPWAGKSRQVPFSLLTWLFTAYTAVSSVAIMTGHYPDCFISGIGLTDFKVYSEYIIVTLYIISIILFYHRITSAQTKSPADIFIIISLLFSTISELFFTRYLDVFDNYNAIGHLLKAVSFYMIYKAVIEVSIQEPFSEIFRQVQEEGSSLRQINEQLQQRLNNYLHYLSFYRFALDSSAIVTITDKRGIIEHANDNF